MLLQFNLCRYQIKQAYTAGTVEPRLSNAGGSVYGHLVKHTLLVTQLCNGIVM